MLFRWFHWARLVSKYRITVSSFYALLQFQYHSCEEIVYFSRDFSTTFIQYIHHNEVTSGQQVLFRWFHWARLESKYWIFSIHFLGTSSISVQQLWRDSLLFKDFRTTFIQYIHHNEVTSGQQVLYRELDLNRSTENQYPLFRHFFNFSTAAVKR